MNVLIRADASKFIGIGHVMRCLTLANALSELGHQVHFVCREHIGHLGEKILTAGHRLYLLPKLSTSIKSKPDTTLSPPHLNWLGVSWETDFEQTKQVLGGLKVDWLVVDHYALDASWESSMSSLAKHILVIDDLADRPHNCDILLDQTVNKTESIYKGLVPDYCELLVGSDYALLRPEFALLRSKSLARRKKPVLKQLAIVLGGGDQSSKILNVLNTIQISDLDRSAKVVIVMSADNLHYSQVCFLAEQMEHDTEILSYVEDMAELMVNTDLVIGAGGGASLERCSLGVPTLLVVLAENQRENARALSAMKAAYIIDDLAASLQAGLNDFIKTPQRLKDLSEAASALVDARGVQRVLQRLQCQI